MDILYLLDRLEEVLTSARHVPFSSNVMLDSQECIDVVDQIRLSLPEEMKLARRVMEERDQVLAEAEERANRMLERAEEQIAVRVEDHAVVQAAEERAQGVLERAEREADELRRQADDYAYRVFSTLQNRLRQIDDVVQDGLAELRPEVRSDLDE
jgi:vacuolar-type H+-ATPase subunit H